MSRRALVVLLGALIVLAILVGIAGIANRRGAGGQDLLLPGLKAELNDISQITIKGAGDKTIATLRRGDQRWIVVERNNYPADLGKIRTNLLALSDATIVEEKTSNPEFYDRLGVDDIAKPAARGLQLEIAGPKATTSVLIGDNSGSSMAYARRAGEPKSWLVTGKLDLGKTPGDWLDRQVLEIPATRIQSVTITHPGIETLVVERTARDAPDFTVRNLPAGRELAFPGAASAIGGVLAALAFDDVQTRDSLGPDPGKPVVARFATFDGLVIEASAWRVPDGTRVTFTASADKALAEQFAGAPKSAEKQPTYADVLQEAQDINQRLGGWVYTLPGFKSEQLTRKLGDLLKPAGGQN